MFVRIQLRALLALAMVGTAFGGEPGTSPGRTLTTAQRLEPAHLEATRVAVEKYRASRKPLTPLRGLNDYRVILHAHAGDSSHTGGTPEEILADAKKEGVDVIMLADHFRPPRDFMDGWRGMKDGVLFIPGAEMHGFLLYPDASVFAKMDGPKEDLIAATTAGTGLIFLSHVEERMDHPMAGLTGMEAYNRHDDANDDTGILLQIVQWATDPVQSKEFAERLAKYPDEILAAQLDYPVEYFQKWDRETPNQRVVGIAANDCHHNQVFIVKMVDAENVLIGTVVDDDDEMRPLNAKMRPGIPEMTKGRQPGDILTRFDFDPYYRSFRNVSTHVLATELTEPAIRAAIAAGHAYISHDWMCEPESVHFYTASGGDSTPELIMGDEGPHKPLQKLVFEVPVDCILRILKNGEELARANGNSIHRVIDGPGVYRAEAWLEIDGEERIWIYTNPIYLR